MAVPSVPLFGNPTRVSGSVAIKASPGKLWFVQLDGGTAASSVNFHNDIDSAGGTALYSVVAPFTAATSSAQGTVPVNLIPVGGIDFSTGIWAELAGTGAIAYVWFS